MRSPPTIPSPRNVSDAPKTGTDEERATSRRTSRAILDLPWESVR